MNRKENLQVADVLTEDELKKVLFTNTFYWYFYRIYHNILNTFCNLQHECQKVTLKAKSVPSCYKSYYQKLRFKNLHSILKWVKGLLKNSWIQTRKYCNMREKTAFWNFVQRPLRNVEKYKTDFSKFRAQISTNTLKLPTFYLNLKQP